MIHIATISGGKDSTVMCDLLLKNGYPVDYIIFNDTLAEHDLMYEYIEKLKTYFHDRYGKTITVLKPRKNPEDLFFRKIKRKSSEWYGWVKGVPAPVMGFCEWRTESKIRPLEIFIKENNLKNVKIYIGFTTDESKRASSDEDKIYPLIADFNMSERNCKEYLIKQEMENPLYRYFTRTGCKWCPAQSEKAFFNIWKHFNADWEYMKDVERRLQELEDAGEKIVYKHWFPTGASCIEMEKKFIEADKQDSLFDFSDEPLKDCFCKI